MSYELKQLKLTNYTIEEGINKWNKKFYKIVNADDNHYYFCFGGVVKAGWDLLENNSLKGEGIEIEYKEKEDGERIFKQVVHIYQEDLLI